MVHSRSMESRRLIVLVLRIVSIVSVSLLAAVAQPARAQTADDTSPRDPVLAEGLFWEGRRASDAGDFDTACARFAESQRFDPAPGTLINLADCEEQRGRTATAWGLYREVLGALGPSDERRTTYVRARIAELEPKLPRLTVRDGTETKGLRITRDGSELGAASHGVALPVDPGKHVVVAKAGKREARFEIELAPGESRELLVSAADLGGASATQPAKKSDARPRQPGGTPTVQRTAGWVLLGLGAAGLAAGTITGLLAIGRSGEVEDQCDAGYACKPAGVEAADSGRLFAQVSTVAFVAGIASAASGTVLVLTAPGPPRSASLGASFSTKW